MKTNPFFILHASGRDDEKTILKKAKETELLYGISTAKEQNELFHPTGRIKAEIGYLPDIPEESIDRVREYLLAQDSDSKTLPDPMPDYMPKAGPARMNGAAAILSAWQIGDVISAEAACLSLVKLCDETTAKDSLEQINADREAAGIAPLKDTYMVRDILKSRKSKLLKELADRIRDLPPALYRELRHNLAVHFCDKESPYFRSLHLDQLVTRYLSASLEAEKEWEKKRIESYAGRSRELADQKRIETRHLKQLNDQVTLLLESLAVWDQLTGPDRMIARGKGFTAGESDEMYDTIHELFIDIIHDGNLKNAKRIICCMDDIFTDVSSQRRDLIKQKKDILMGKKGI